MYNAHATVQDKKVYVAGGASPVDNTMDQVYVYEINTDHWDQLPPSGHWRGIPQIIGGKLAIIGGRLSSTTKMVTNKVSTFNNTSKIWTSFYPNLLLPRGNPGVVTHLEHVIVAGGGKFVKNAAVLLDDIEVLNWMKNSHWQKVSIVLPVPMAIFTPIITEDHFLIVGYTAADLECNNSAYKIPVGAITRSGDQQTSDTPTKWITVTNATHWGTTLVPNSSPPVVVGGNDPMQTSDIKMYDKSWKTIASLSSAKTAVAIAAVNNNAIIVIGGCDSGGSVNDVLSSSLTTVELGQAQLLQ